MAFTTRQNVQNARVNLALAMEAVQRIPYVRGTSAQVEQERATYALLQNVQVALQALSVQTQEITW